MINYRKYRGQNETKQNNPKRHHREAITKIQIMTNSLVQMWQILFPKMAGKIYPIPHIFLQCKVVIPSSNSGAFL